MDYQKEEMFMEKWDGQEEKRVMLEFEQGFIEGVEEKEKQSYVEERLAVRHGEIHVTTKTKPLAF